MLRKKYSEIYYFYDTDQEKLQRNMLLLRHRLVNNLIMVKQLRTD